MWRKLSFWKRGASQIRAENTANLLKKPMPKRNGVIADNIQSDPVHDRQCGRYGNEVLRWIHWRKMDPNCGLLSVGVLTVT